MNRWYYTNFQYFHDKKSEKIELAISGVTSSMDIKNNFEIY